MSLLAFKIITLCTHFISSSLLISSSHAFFAPLPMATLSSLMVVAELATSVQEGALSSLIVVSELATAALVAGYFLFLDDGS